MNLRILYQDDQLVAVDKPAGFHVHPPEDASIRISPNTNSLLLLKRQLGKYLYPVHRLDRATSGVLVFALNPDAANGLARLFRDREIRKTYFCVVRGWVPENGVIDHPLKVNPGLKTQVLEGRDGVSTPPLSPPGTYLALKGEVSLGSVKNSLERAAARTSFDRIAQLELPISVGKYSTARYSLVRVEPHTGRMHQIRRHFAHISHPLIGDTVYGAGEHNRIYRDQFSILGLLLKAYSLEFNHPIENIPLKISSRWNGTWHKVFDLFGVCPRESRESGLG